MRQAIVKIDRIVLKSPKLLMKVPIFPLNFSVLLLYCEITFLRIYEFIFGNIFVYEGQHGLSGINIRIHICFHMLSVLKVHLSLCFYFKAVCVFLFNIPCNRI